MQNQTAKSNLITILIIIFIFALAVQPYQPVQALPMMFIVTNTNDSGSGSLRWAIIQSNSNSGKDTIVFNIPTSDPNYYTGSGYFVIPLLSYLPPLDDLAGVIIDATTQTTFTGDTNPLGPEIEVVAGAFPFTGTFFTLVAGDTTIKGLSLSGDGNGIGIDIFPASHNNTITQNYIGIGPRGNQCGGGHSIGIRIYSQNNTINNNLISCNESDAIQLQSNSNLNQIMGNIIGLTAQKNFIGNLTAPYFGNCGNGIFINSSNTNTISDNYISQNQYIGILMQDSNFNTIQRNVIGVNDTDSDSLGNGLYGILLQDNSTDNLIKENYVAGNGMTGIYLTDSGTWGNQLRQNRIGLNKNNHLIPNGHHGIGIYKSAHANIIGSLYDPNEGNTIVGNSWSGIAIDNYAHHNTIGQNFIGTNKVGNNLGNNGYGIHIVNSQTNLITSNTIAFNGAQSLFAGVLVDGATANNNQISKNSIYANNNIGIKLLNGGNGGITPPFIEVASRDFVEGIGCPACTVEIFSDGGNQGRIYEGNIGTTSTTGYFKLHGPFSGPNITATMTDSFGNTSMFTSPIKISANYIYLPLITR